MAELTRNCIQMMHRGEKIENPIVQLLHHKIFKHTTENKYGLRAALSDGTHTHPLVIFSPRIKDSVTDETVPFYSIIRLDRYFYGQVPFHEETRGVLYILEFTTITKGNEVRGKIGAPTLLFNFIPPQNAIRAFPVAPPQQQRMD